MSFSNIIMEHEIPRRIFTKFSILIAIFSFFSCAENKENFEIVDYENKNKNFEQVFNVIDTITINKNITSKRKVISITKFIKTSDTSFIFLDGYNHSIYQINNNGKILKTIAKKGHGPGEFQIIMDFTIDKKGNLYVVGMSESKIGKFNSNGEFNKFFELSFSHRGPQSIKLLPNGNFLITAKKNLTSNSTKSNYKFVGYEKMTFLHVYSPQFDLIKSFLHPSQKLKKTRGKFARPYYSAFVQYAIYKDKIFALTQEGFYELQIFTTSDYRKTQSFKLFSESFTEFDLNSIRDLKFANKSWNYSRKKLGEINASYSRPHYLCNINNIFILEIHDPFDNYYPQYRKKFKTNSFHFDVFRFNKNSIIPIVSNVSGVMKLIGKSENDSENLLYFVAPKAKDKKTTINVYEARIKYAKKQ